MLDIKLVRENPELIKKDLNRRGTKEKLKYLKDLIQKDKKYRKLLQETEDLRRKRNEITKTIQELKIKKNPFKSEIAEAKKIPKKIKELDKETKKLKEKIQFYLLRLPNILHESVPPGKDESDNVEIKKHGSIPKFSFDLKHHGSLATELGLIDFERAVKISGEGFFFLKGSLALMDIALQRFAIDLLNEKGFTLIQPPLMMRRKPYEGVTDLEDFENVMYKIDPEGLYLIATSEHPIASMYLKEILPEKILPIKLAGVSPCFRREVGKHGLDERGLFRVHHFNKIEQFIFCKPEDSWKFHEELLKNAEDFLKKLEIPFNVTNVCSADIGTIAAKKYDINGWSPRAKKYIELMSVSNCTAYQSTRLGTKYRKSNGEKEFVHTLNATMVATTRLLRCIIENYQTKEGTIKVPKALQPYMNGLKEMKSEN